MDELRAARQAARMGCGGRLTGATIVCYTSLPMKEFHETTVRVRYAETDQLGVVYHSNFLV